MTFKFISLQYLFKNWADFLPYSEDELKTLNFVYALMIDRILLIFIKTVIMWLQDFKYSKICNVFFIPEV